MDGEGCSKKDVPFLGEKKKRPGSLRHQSKEEKGLATFEGRKIALLKVMRKKSPCLLRWAKCCGVGCTLQRCPSLHKVNNTLLSVCIAREGGGAFWSLWFPY